MKTFKSAKLNEIMARRQARIEAAKVAKEPVKVKKVEKVKKGKKG